MPNQRCVDRMRMAGTERALVNGAEPRHEDLPDSILNLLLKTMQSSPC